MWHEKDRCIMSHIMNNGCLHFDSRTPLQREWEMVYSLLCSWWNQKSARMFEYFPMYYARCRVQIPKWISFPEGHFTVQPGFQLGNVWSILPFYRLNICVSLSLNKRVFDFPMYLTSSGQKSVFDHPLPPAESTLEVCLPPPHT